MNQPNFERKVTLLDLLDRILDKGVVVSGDLTISVADVDLIYVGLRLLLGSVESANRLRQDVLILDDAQADDELFVRAD